MRFTLLIFALNKLLYTQCKNFFLEFSLIPAFTFEPRVAGLHQTSSCCHNNPLALSRLGPRPQRMLSAAHSRGLLTSQRPGLPLLRGLPAPAS